MKKLLVLIVCFSFIGVGNIYGQPLKRHTLELRPEISYIWYKEPDIAPFVDVKTKGVMYGAAVSYAYHNHLMLKVEARGSLGYVDYHNSGSVHNIRDYILEFRGLGGWDFFLLKGFTMTPYIGMGYRYLNDDLGGKVSSIGALGYDRESNYIYSPLGIEFNIDLKNNWFIGEIFEYDHFWWGKQESHLSDANPGFNDLSNRQKRGWGFRGSLVLRKKGKIVDFEFGPFIRIWDISKSEEELITLNGVPVNVGFEPKNKSKEIGFLIALKF